MVEAWQVVTRRDDGAEVVIGLHLDETDAVRQVAMLADDGVEAVIMRADMGECGCRG